MVFLGIHSLPAISERKCGAHHVRCLDNWFAHSSPASSNTMDKLNYRGFPTLALGVDPPAHDLMKHPLRKIEDSILAPSRFARIIWQGFLLSLGILSAFIATLIIGGVSLFGPARSQAGFSISLAQTVALPLWLPCN